MAVETASTVASAITEIEPDGAGNPIYLGKAPIGSATSSPVWQIRQLTFNGGGYLTRIRFANGSLAYTSVWDDRASLTYS